MARYRAVRRCSVRKSPDKKSSAFEEWCDWNPGDGLDDAPEHAPLDEWLADGVIEEVKAGGQTKRSRR